MLTTLGKILFSLGLAIGGMLMLYSAWALICLVLSLVTGNYGLALFGMFGAFYWYSHYQSLATVITIVLLLIGTKMLYDRMYSSVEKKSKSA